LGEREEELIIEVVILEKSVSILNSLENLFEPCYALRSVFKAGCVLGTASPLKKEHCCSNEIYLKCFRNLLATHLSLQMFVKGNVA